MTELPPGWGAGLAGDLCEVVGGATPRTDTPEFWGGDVPWVTPDDLSRDRSQYIAAGRRSLTPMGLASCAATVVPPGTVLFTSRAPIGYTAIAASELATNQGFKSLVPSAALAPGFLYWQLQHLTEQIRAMGSGTTFAEVSKKVMATVLLVVAPLAEQARIVVAIEEAVSKLDAGAAGLGTVRQLLKRMREAVLAAAVTGRLVPQDPTDTPAGKLLADRGATPVESFEQASLPTSWAWTRVGDLLLKPLANGRSVRSREGGFPVLRLTCLRDGRIDLNERKDGEWSAPDAAPYLVQRGDFLVSRGNGTLSLVGRGGLVDSDPDPVAFPDTLIRVQVDESVLAPRLLAVWWNSPVVRRQLEAKARTTAGIYKVNQAMLAEVRLPIPAHKEQLRIIGELDRQFSFIAACERAVDAGLARSLALRRLVLKAAFEGRLVSQNPSDESASELLERIRAERAGGGGSSGGRRRKKANET